MTELFLLFRLDGTRVQSVRDDYHVFGNASDRWLQQMFNVWPNENGLFFGRLVLIQNRIGNNERHGVSQLYVGQRIDRRLSLKLIVFVFFIHIIVVK